MRFRLSVCIIIHCNNGYLTIEYGYLSFMFDLSTPDTVKNVQNMCMKESGIDDRGNDSPLVPCEQPRGEHPLRTL